MPSEVVPCIGRVPDYTIKEGIMYISAGEWSCCMPLRIFRMGCARADRVIAEYEAKSAEVIPMQKRGHAAS